MREGVWITEVQKIWQALQTMMQNVQGLAQGLQITTISQSVRDKALENILISKGLITQAELEAEVKKEAQALVEEAEKAKATSTIVTHPSGLILPPSSGV